MSCCQPGSSTSEGQGMEISAFSSALRKDQRFGFTPPRRSSTSKTQQKTRHTVSWRFCIYFNLSRVDVSAEGCRFTTHPERFIGKSTLCTVKDLMDSSSGFLKHDFFLVRIDLRFPNQDNENFKCSTYRKTARCIVCLTSSFLPELKLCSSGK